VDHCIFCEIIAGRAVAGKIYKNGLWVVFMDIQDVNSEHYK
jgi:diadenosine tetraphosphate (Ap4A) HIT family hydrolase